VFWIWNLVQLHPKFFWPNFTGSFFLLGFDQDAFYKLAMRAMKQAQTYQACLKIAKGLVDDFLKDEEICILAMDL